MEIQKSRDRSYPMKPKSFNSVTMVYKFLIEEFEGTKTLQDLGIDVRIILKYVVYTRCVGGVGWT